MFSVKYNFIAISQQCKTRRRDQKTIEILVILYILLWIVQVARDYAFTIAISLLMRKSNYKTACHARSGDKFQVEQFGLYVYLLHKDKKSLPSLSKIYRSGNKLFWKITICFVSSEKIPRDLMMALLKMNIQLQ